MSDMYKKKDAAERYDIARALPDETTALWMDKLVKLVPLKSVSRALDLGGGTGRFAGLLQKTYRCPVVVIDPAEEMLEQGRNRGIEGIVWLCGTAESIALDARSVDLVWMSNVFHHLENPPKAFQEVNRILNTNGYLAIRNGTRETDVEIEWINFFPEAKKIDKGRIPSRADVINTVCRQGFDEIKTQPVYQLFASTYDEYYEKISQRGLSSLISISDEAFYSGLRRFREWVTSQLPDKTVVEPIDLFVFRKR